MSDPKGFARMLLALSVCALATGCDDENSGDASCPEGTVRSGDECVASDAGVNTDDGVDPDDGVPPDPDDGVPPDQGPDMGPPPGDLPVILDEVYAPSGYMGDGETGGIVETNDCGERGGEGQGICHHFVHTPGDAGWGGVWWQYPAENWGDAPGYPVPAGVTRLQFAAWGANGGETITFGAGYGPADGFAVEETIELTTSPTVYSIDLAGVPYADIAGGFVWVNEGAAGGVDFFVDDIQFAANPADMVDPCTVSCATLRGLGECAGVPAYGVCKSQCADRQAGDCAAQSAAFVGCVDDAGWRCENDAPVANNDCAAQSAALAECLGGQAAELPFYIDDHFVMSGMMGGGEVAVGDCPMDDGDGTCRAITWTPGEAPWTGFYFQYPENNWGDLPGLAINPGATHVRYRVWGATGGERAKFGVGIQDADGFQNESDYIELPTEPMDAFLPIPDGIVEITGGFAWYLENPNGAESITFYLDEVQWRDDAPPGGAAGCTDMSAANFNAQAEQDDGSCEYPITFNVDMNCTEEPFAEVLISGPFCEWCGEGFALTDDDGDGVWSGTFPFRAGELEYKYIVDGFDGQENLIDDVAAGDGACAPVTDGANFANRQIQVAGAAELDETYGRCSACGEEPPPPPEGAFQSITFDEDDRQYGLAGFGGADESMVVADPTDAANTVLQINKNDMAELWAGVTVFYGPNNSVQDIPLDADNTQMTMRVWSPDAGTVFRIKIENADDAGVSVETEATSMAAGAWEELTFDFANQAPGTAAANPAATYNRLSVFGGFGTSGVDAGEAKTYYVDDIIWIGGGGGPIDPPVESQMTFRVDMNCTEQEFESVSITGPFCDWCADGFELGDDDGDGVYEGTFPFPAGPLEYKYMVDGFAAQEDLIGDGDCAPITDGAEFANRQINVAGDAVQEDVYGQCTACGDEPPPVDGEFTSITFDEDDREYSLAGFGGADESVVADDPTDPENTVLQINKNDMAELWAGVTVSYGPNDSVQRIPLDAENTQLTMRVWSPDANTVFRVKIEDATDPTVSVETEATSMAAGEWAELTFDFGNQAPGTAAANPASTYDRLSVFGGFGTTGADAGEAKTYYVDDITWIGGRGPVDPPGDAMMTFRVDMNCTDQVFQTVSITGPFCEWCAAGFELGDDDDDGVYEGTFPFPAGPLEYKYMVDGFAAQEDLIGDGDCAPITDGANFANRQIEVAGDAVQEDVYGQCTACGDEPPPVDGEFTSITFDEDDREYALAGFGGAEASAVVDNPTEDGNALEINKSDAAELWAGVTVSYGANDSVQRIPLDAENTQLTMRVWSPDANTVFRVKIEDATDPTVSVETEATSMVAGEWAELTFDFGNQAPGTAAANPAATYNRLSVFGGFGTTGADAGEAKTYYVDDITWIGGRGPVDPPGDAMMTFRVDMNCTDQVFQTVSITGPFCEWCAAGFELGDDDDDGVYEGTFPFPAGPLEYKYMVDGFAAQEDLIGDGDCAPITDGANFANRQIEVAGDAVQEDVYGQCTACDDEPPAGGEFTAITFDEDDREYALAGFGGAEASAVVDNPTEDGNALEINKSDAAELWAGVTVSYGPNQTVERFPLDAQNTQLTMRVWSPDANIEIRVKIEDSTNGAVSVETVANTTVAGEWEELSFDFAMQAPGTAAADPAATYDRISIFANFGQTGAMAGAKTYYIDDITWVGGAGPVDPPAEGAFFEQAFDAMASIDGWMRVANADSDEASITWEAGAGNPGGAMLIAAENTEEAGRAYIFQYNGAPTDFTGAPSVTVSFDAKLDSPLVASALHLQTLLPGPGVVNNFDLQAQGLNGDTWTSYAFEFAGVTPGEGAWFVHFNFAAGAVVGAGGAVLIDNLMIAPTQD